MSAVPMHAFAVIKIPFDWYHTDEPLSQRMTIMIVLFVFSHIIRKQLVLSDFMMQRGFGRTQKNMTSKTKKMNEIKTVLVRNEELWMCCCRLFYCCTFCHEHKPYCVSIERRNWDLTQLILIAAVFSERVEARSFFFTLSLSFPIRIPVWSWIQCIYSIFRCACNSYTKIKLSHIVYISVFSFVWLV